ncbi:MAG: hexose kinase, partial [Clostridia bacterium]|nr:hexose kinase [Clostridia bacterium]
VAIVTAALGAKSECIGFMYREGGALFEERLANGGAECDFVWCDGAVRVNVKVFDKSRGEITEINQSGSMVSKQQLAEMTEMVKRHAAQADYLILTGSLPPGCPADYYYALAKAAAGENCRVILDADGDRLSHGLKAKPFLIKPNRYELEMLIGRELPTIGDILAAAEEIVSGGVDIVAVSMGGDGALVCDGKRAYLAHSVKIDVKSTVAAGDSMIAGFATGFERGYDLPEAFRMGVAAATVRCMTPPEEMISEQAVSEMAERIRMEKIK